MGNVNNKDSDGQTLLYKAAKTGDIMKCKKLLSRGANTEIADKRGWSPLLEAAGRGHIDVCELLLKAGADADHVNDSGDTPLYWAASGGHKKVCEVLLKVGAAIVDHANNNGDTPLYWAAFHGHDKVCELLLMAGAAVDLANNNGSTPLSQAARGEKYNMCQLLTTKYGADCKHSSVREYLNRMLEWAAEHMDVKMSALLLVAGAQGALYCPEGIVLEYDPVYKMVALYFAARDGKHRQCKQYLEQQADPNLTDTKGQTPLYFSCSDGSISLMKKLINNGADVNAAGCLLIALDLYYLDVAEILIDHGCDVNQVKIHLQICYL